MKYLLEIQKSGYKAEDKEAFARIEIDDQELDYIMDQLKFNQPVVLVMENNIFCFSPMQCVFINISPIDEK